MKQRVLMGAGIAAALCPFLPWASVAFVGSLSLTANGTSWLFFFVPGVVIAVCARGSEKHKSVRPRVAAVVAAVTLLLTIGTLADLHGAVSANAGLVSMSIGGPFELIAVVVALIFSVMLGVENNQIAPPEQWAPWAQQAWKQATSQAPHPNQPGPPQGQYPAGQHPTGPYPAGPYPAGHWPAPHPDAEPRPPQPPPWPEPPTQG